MRTPVRDHTTKVDTVIAFHLGSVSLFRPEPSFTVHHRIALLAVCLAFALNAVAQQPLRTVPAEVKRGRMSHAQDMDVLLDGSRVRLAPGVLIRDTGNRFVLPVDLPPNAVVGYLTNLQGQIDRVWILTPEEAARPAPRR